MAQHRFQISKPIHERLQELHTQLTDLGVELEGLTADVREEHDGHRDAYGETTEKWQETARGSDVDEWITSLESLVDELDELGTSLDTITGNIDDLPQKPEA